MLRSCIVYFLRCFSLCALLSGAVTAQERHLHTYTMQHALPEQIMPALAAQLAPGSSVTPYRQQLILNVTDAEYRTLTTLLEQLDAAPRSLLISVRKQTQQLDDTERYGVQGRIGEGAVQVQSGSGWQQRTQTHVTINRGNTQSVRDGAQQVRAVEGMEAFISVGNTVSMPSGNYGERELVSAQSGFYATARIVGDEVIVDIDQRDDRVQGRGIATQSLQTQHLQTQLRGALGQWIPLGGLSAAQSDSERALTRYGSGTSNTMTDLAIKVEVIDR